MSKRLFQILDEMNVADGENKTAHVKVCPDLISANKVKAGTKITMGAPEISVYNLMNGKTKAILLLIDLDEYNKIKSS